MNASSVRQENDFLGSRSIPAAACWGVHTARAVENFPISGQTLSCMPELVRALAFVKQRLSEARALLTEVSLGATAVGTGINAPSGYAETVVPPLAQISSVPVVSAPHLVEPTQDAGAFVQVSGVLKRVACKLSKTCHDLANRATIADTADALGVMSAAEVQALLVPERLTRPSPLGG
jgi:aspartate ammonia-lyase